MSGSSKRAAFVKILQHPHAGHALRLALKRSIAAERQRAGEGSGDYTLLYYLPCCASWHNARVVHL